MVHVLDSEQSEEQAVLVDGDNVVLGVMSKSQVHTDHTPLHRGFSLFLMNNQGEILLQQRSHLKKTWPLVWSNSCCGHPAYGERVEAAIRRRLQYELGLQADSLQEILSDFQYRCIRDGIWENEICPVWVGYAHGELQTHPSEVEAWRWVDWDQLLNDASERPAAFSEWMVWELEELVSSGWAPQARR